MTEVMPQHAIAERISSQTSGDVELRREHARARKQAHV